MSLYQGQMVELWTHAASFHPAHSPESLLFLLHTKVLVDCVVFSCSNYSKLLHKCCCVQMRHRWNVAAKLSPNSQPHGLLFNTERNAPKKLLSLMCKMRRSAVKILVEDRLQSVWLGLPSVALEIENNPVGSVTQAKNTAYVAQMSYCALHFWSLY